MLPNGRWFHGRLDALLRRTETRADGTPYTVFDLTDKKTRGGSMGTNPMSARYAAQVLMYL